MAVERPHLRYKFKKQNMTRVFVVGAIYKPIWCQGILDSRSAYPLPDSSRLESVLYIYSDQVTRTTCRRPDTLIAHTRCSRHEPKSRCGAL